MPQEPNETTDRRESAPRHRRKPVRRDPEKRRQQNIVAQRKYRQKQRDRLEHLEALASSTVQPQGIESAGGGTELPSTACPRTSKSAPLYETWDASISGLSASTPSGLSDLFTPGMTIWDSSIHDLQPSEIPIPIDAWPDTEFVDPLLLSVKANGNQGTEWMSIHCGCSCPHFQMRSQGSTPSDHAGVEIQRVGPGLTMSDTYVNHLRIEMVCTIDALYTLGMHVGINEELFCADESISPFYRFSGDSTNDKVKSTMIKSVQGIFKTLKPDMRPSSEQITIKHHPCIDLLPFPTLRNNFIKSQEEIDEDEFFQDMLVGLVCWGGSGLSKRDRGESTGYGSTGTPWDSRSWEGKTWFLKKYWTLIGGEDGELARQSEWWRNIRGDDIEVDNQM